jgi:hypothetical protein
LETSGYTLFSESVTALVASSFASPPTQLIIENEVIVQRGTTCNIKGNVNINSRERIYHVPGLHYYEVTMISPRATLVLLRTRSTSCWMAQGRLLTAFTEAHRR